MSGDHQYGPGIGHMAQWPPEDEKMREERDKMYVAQRLAEEEMRKAQTLASRELLVMQSRAEALRQSIATFSPDTVDTARIVERATGFAAFLETGETAKPPTH